MNKQETIKSLVNFADYMVEVEDDFQQMTELKKEYDKSRKGANSIWASLLSFMSKFAFIYATISLVDTIILHLRNLSVDSLTGLSALTCKIFLPAWWMVVTAVGIGVLFSFWAKKELQLQGAFQNDRDRIQNKIRTAYSNIEEQYKGYKNPPVSINYSNPYFVLDVVKVMEDSKKENITVNEAINTAKAI